MGPIKESQAKYRGNTNQPHDLVFSAFVEAHGGGRSAITHVHGVYSMPPGGYMHCPTYGGFCPPHETEFGKLPGGIIKRFPG